MPALEFYIVQPFISVSIWFESTNKRLKVWEPQVKMCHIEYKCCDEYASEKHCILVLEFFSETIFTLFIISITIY